MAPPLKLAVRLSPRAGRDAIEGWMQDAGGRPCLEARVSAAPVDGAANEALVRLVARTLGRPAGAVRLASGERARAKLLEIDGVDATDLARVFGRPP